MGTFLVKLLISALLVAGASELARRSTIAGAILVSLPLTSVLAILWLWHDTHDVQRVARFGTDILWLVLPSLLLFIVLPFGLRLGWGFWLSLGIAVVATLAAYAATVAVRGALA
jgi:hypothetical protein